MQLALDATRLAAEFRTLILVSGDSDFLPLLEHMRDLGVRTVVSSFPVSTSNALRRAADEFINLEDALAAPVPAAGNAMMDHQPSTQIVFDKGQCMAPYLRIRELLLSPTFGILIIDSYLGVEVFECLACIQNKTSVAVTFITDEKKLPKDFSVLVGHARRDGFKIRTLTSTDFHDRYLKIDEIWWHSGHSFKDLGSRVSQLSQVNVENIPTLRQIEERILASATELCPI
jgi:hypothetical protein